MSQYDRNKEFQELTSGMDNDLMMDDVIADPIHKKMKAEIQEYNMNIAGGDNDTQFYIDAFTSDYGDFIGTPVEVSGAIEHIANCAMRELIEIPLGKTTLHTYEGLGFDATQHKLRHKIASASGSISKIREGELSAIELGPDAHFMADYSDAHLTFRDAWSRKHLSNIFTHDVRGIATGEASLLGEDIDSLLMCGDPELIFEGLGRLDLRNIISPLEELNKMRQSAIAWYLEKLLDMDKLCYVELDLESSRGEGKKILKFDGDGSTQTVQLRNTLRGAKLSFKQFHIESYASITGGRPAIFMAGDLMHRGYFSRPQPVSVPLCAMSNINVTYPWSFRTDN